MSLAPLTIAKPQLAPAENGAGKPRHRGQGLGKVGAEAPAAQGPKTLQPDTESAAFGRLLGVDGAARYLGVSPWLVQQYIQAGDLPTVQLPRPRTASALRKGSRRPIGDTLRMVLLDRRDLDEFVDHRARKERRSP